MIHAETKTKLLGALSAMRDTATKVRNEAGCTGAPAAFSETLRALREGGTKRAAVPALMADAEVRAIHDEIEALTAEAEQRFVMRRPGGCGCGKC